MSGRMTALCCVCGEVRTVARGYSAGNTRVCSGEGMDAELLADCQSRGHWLEQEPFWRCLTILKCRHCAERTRHALIRDDAQRNHVEDVDHGLDPLREYHS